MVPLLCRAVSTAALALASASAAALDAPLPMDGDQAWVYLRETGSNGLVATTERYEVSTAFQDRTGRWVTAIRPIDAQIPASAAATSVRIHAIAPGQGCLFDVLDGQALQTPPCTQDLAPGQTWTQSTRADSRREFKAIGMERIHVPTGDFEALRVESVESTVLVSASGARSAVPTLRVVYWYVPRVGAMAQVDRDILRPDGTVAQHQHEVLESFGAPSEVSRIGVRATSQWQASERAKALHARIVAILASTPPTTKPARLLTLDQKCRPEYPPAAIRAGATGDTRVLFIVGANGAVEGSEIASASGPTREHRLLDSATQVFLSRCSFSPALLDDGTPTVSVVTITYSWKLE